MDEGRRAHESPEVHGENVRSPPLLPSQSIDLHEQENQLITSPKSSALATKNEDIQGRLDSQILVHRRYYEYGEEQDGPSSHPEPATEEPLPASPPIPNMSSEHIENMERETRDPTNENDEANHNNKTGPSQPKTERNMTAKNPQARTVISRVPNQKDISMKKAPSFHGLVYQSYYEYGNDEGNLADRGLGFGTPLISLIPDTQPANRAGGVNSGGPTYRIYRHNNGSDDEWGMSPHPGRANTQPENRSFTSGHFWVYSKLALHLIAVTLAACSLGLSLSLITNKDLNESIVIASCPIGQSAVAIGWGVVELIAIIYSLKTRTGPSKHFRGIPPVGHLAVCLILCVACAVAAYFQRSAISNIDGYCGRSYSEALLTDNWKELCQKTWFRKRPLVNTIAILNIGICLLYFILFIAACIDTTDRN